MNGGKKGFVKISFSKQTVGRNIARRNYTPKGNKDNARSQLQQETFFSQKWKGAEQQEEQSSLLLSQPSVGLFSPTKQNQPTRKEQLPISVQESQNGQEIDVSPNITITVQKEKKNGFMYFILGVYYR